MSDSRSGAAVGFVSGAASRDDAREILDQVIACARETGQTQWLARVESVAPFDAIECYAQCPSRDRFYWERAEAGHRFVAFGAVDEIESAGPRRFEDVDGWATDLRARLHWAGASRDATAPLLLGGFGFTDEAASPSEWKSFPSARFVLPATIAEVVGGEARWVEIVRVEPGCAPETIETEWSRRERERAPRAPFARIEAAKVPADEVDHELLAQVGAWPSGPEYRVRSDRPHSVFTGQVSAALQTIEAGTLEKVVLARRLEVNHDGDLEIPVFLARLREMYPTCTLIAIGRGDDTFLAATPETLVRLHGNRVETVALAGSAPRGRTPEEDADLAAALAASNKEQAEHAHVVSAIREALGRYCQDVTAPDRPVVRALFGIQHLETPITGHLRDGDAPSGGDDASPVEAPGVLALVRALHPTPAVGGVPRRAAVEWLRRFEGLDRGWYASPIGWLDADAQGGGGGDFSVALRSALVQGTGAGPGDAGRAFLFAGAGIVPGSDPDRELAETRIKLRALLAPLTEI